MCFGDMHFFQVDGKQSKQQNTPNVHKITEKTVLKLHVDSDLMSSVAYFKVCKHIFNTGNRKSCRRLFLKGECNH